MSFINTLNRYVKQKVKIALGKYTSGHRGGFPKLYNKYSSTFW